MEMEGWYGGLGMGVRLRYNSNATFILRVDWVVGSFVYL
jgi:hypothetical protein